MKSVIKAPFLIIGSLIRMLIVGGISSLFCVYTVDYLLSSTYGTFNLPLVMTYFVFVCSFSVLFVEIFMSMQRRSKKKEKYNVEQKKYGLN